MMPPIDMMQQCAPNVAPQTIAAIIQVESGGNQYALGVNGPIGKRPHPKNVQETANLARYYISKGYSVDLGLMQINSRNLPGLGYTIEQVLEPCNNLRAGSRILSRGYAGAAKRFGPGQDALRAALSAYNTGNYERGFQNGYVVKYYCGNGVRVIVKAPPPARILASAKKPVSAPKAAFFNPYNADLVIYNRMEAPENLTTQDSSKAE